VPSGKTFKSVAVPGKRNEEPLLRMFEVWKVMPLVLVYSMKVWPVTPPKPTPLPETGIVRRF